jgi:hypothetical protein
MPHAVSSKTTAGPAGTFESRTGRAAGTAPCATSRQFPWLPLYDDFVQAKPAAEELVMTVM